MSAPFEIVPAGDATLLVRFEERIDPFVNRRAIGMARRLRALTLTGVRDIVPTFRSVAVSFDPLQTGVDTLRDAIAGVASDAVDEPEEIHKTVRIPVRYGGEFGPDLAEVARFASLDEPEVIARHTAVPYRVFMLGFMPGFAYLGSVDERIAVPRRAVPRTRVRAGSVAIADRQTGIYSLESPGGWHLIGWTSIRPFDLGRSEPFLFNPGDEVQFYAAAPSSDRLSDQLLDPPRDPS